MNIKRVLVIEDEIGTCQWLTGCVGQAFPDAVVTECHSVAEARKALATAQLRARAHGHGAPFDVAFIDIGLPDGSGMELIGEINDLDSNCLPIITTIFDDSQMIFDAISAGARGYLLKHHETARLVQLMRRIIDDEPPLSPAVSRHVLAALKQAGGRADGCDVALTSREEEVLSLLARGLQLSAVARMLAISQNTASTHVKSIYRKLNIKSRAEAALMARDRGLLQPE